MALLATVLSNFNVGDGSMEAVIIMSNDRGHKSCYSEVKASESDKWLQSYDRLSFFLIVLPLIQFDIF